MNNLYCKIKYVKRQSLGKMPPYYVGQLVVVLSERCEFHPVGTIITIKHLLPDNRITAGRPEECYHNYSSFQLEPV